MIAINPPDTANGAALKPSILTQPIAATFAQAIDPATGTLTSLGTARNRARTFPLPITTGVSALTDVPRYAYVGNVNFTL